MLNFLFQLENIQHVRHLPDIFHLQNALIHFFQNSHKGENYTVRQFLDQPELSSRIWIAIMPGTQALDSLSNQILAWEAAAVVCMVEPTQPAQEQPIKAGGASAGAVLGGNLGGDGGV